MPFHADNAVQSNAELVAGENQQLKQSDIEELKLQSHGVAIVDALASGSATFAGKTEFSQEKWRRKKSKKYLLYATARRPTARAICEVSIFQIIVTIPDSNIQSWFKHGHLHV